MPSRTVATIVCSGHRTICISESGDLYSFGKGEKGEMGTEEINVFPPQRISSLSNIVSVDCGSFHTICLDNEGAVFTFGWNDYGQLGVGKDNATVEFTSSPQKLNLPPIKQISCGNKFNACVSEDEELYTFGNNSNGALGVGDSNCYAFNSPTKIETLKGIDFVSCGGIHSFCKLNTGEIYAWGSNSSGQLGIKNTSFQYSPIECTNWPQDVVDIKCGDSHTLVLTDKYEVYSCGYNYFGQLGRKVNSSSYSSSLKRVIFPHSDEENSPVFPDIKRIECGVYHSSCIDVNGNLIVFGNCFYGQLGINEKKVIVSEPIQHPFSDIIDISTRGNATFIKTPKGIFSFGRNDNSQLGLANDGKNFNHINPIQVFQDNEDIWHSHTNYSRVKSARK